MLGVVGSNLTIFKLQPTTPNMSQHGSQTNATCCAQQCCDTDVTLVCCNRLAGALNRLHVSVLSFDWLSGLLFFLIGQIEYFRLGSTTLN